MGKARGGIDVERELKFRRGVVDPICAEIDQRGLPMGTRRKRIERDGLPDQIEPDVETPEDPLETRRREHRLRVAGRELECTPV